jgi:SAM-dependent methyltransferase
MAASTTPVPARIAWLVDLLAVERGQRLLELGCGRGVAVDLVCERLGGGHVVGLDRSATAIAAARARNRDWLASGVCSFVEGPVTALDTLDLGRFDSVFAMNVNLFWVRPAATELRLLRRSLAPGGRLHLGWEATQRADEIVDRAGAALADEGFDATVVRSETDPALVCLTAGV